jgi:hypothetical protein
VTGSVVVGPDPVARARSSPTATLDAPTAGAGVTDDGLVRARRVGAGAIASSGVIRLNYLVAGGGIIIPSTRESGVPG